ncbi:putative Tetratricopeptide TPR_2 repeat-containing protein [Crenothrix polyspora]|uniref:Putative Tetratricopeptide TPR_2 repeat-containing protein n=1 Tax=Crenothrix polyspora TaxID=360316 RepID=A0A1R4GZP2_9GAMM|nr:tetratricopeptide repeat protein [Crenothrix polyspora]SJM89280.1 putative Tetratricopeptide TPR_2 repeat-containing protein [Crenothrix polyspora]
MIGFYRNNRLSTIAVLFSTLLLSVACNKGDPKEHLQRGVEYFKQGDYEKAKLELKTSSQSDKDTAETYYYLALLDEKNHQYKAMRENLLKVVELEPKNTEARLKLGKLLLPFGEPDAALEQAEIILKDASQNLDALALKASVFIRKKKQQDALVLIDTMLQKNPKFIDALSLKALIYSEKGETDKALALIDAAMAVDPKNIDLHFFKIQLHVKANNMPAVVADYQHLTTLYPENQDYKITLARLYTQMGKKQDAETLLRDLIIAAPDSIKPKLLLLDFLIDTASEKVVDQLHQFVVHYNDEPRRLLDLANWTLTRKRFDEADKILKQIVDKGDDDAVVIAAKTLLAKMAFERQDLTQAENLIGEILADNSNYNDAKVLQARIFLANKQHDKAIELLNKILLNQPELEDALLLSGQAYVATGDQKKASQYFENALKVNPVNGQALDYLYDKAIFEKKIKLAKDMATAAVKYQANNLDFLEKLANASLLDNDLEGAKIAVQKISELPNPLATDVATYLRAQIFQAEGDCNQAIGLYKALLAKFPGNKDTLDNMAACFDKLNKRSDMIAVLHDLHAKAPDNPSISLLLADLLLREKKMTDGVGVLTELIKNNAKVPQAYSALAKFKTAQNDKNAALAALQEGLKQNPDAIRLSLSLADFYQAQGEHDLAVSVYEGLLANHPNLDVVINSLAVLLTDHYTSNAQMLSKAVQLTERFKDSDQAYYRDTYAWALIKQGRVNEGVTVLQDVITSLPDVPVFRYHLGVAYANSDNNGSAIAELEQALELANKKGAFPEQKEAKILLDKLIAKTRGH